MHHAPIQSDIEPETAIEELTEGGESPDGAHRKLREAHLHTGQTRTRAVFASFFAITNVVAAILVAWAMYGDISTLLILGWLALVGGANWLSWKSALRAHGSDRPTLARKWIAPLESAALAALWASLPTFAFEGQPPEAKVVIGGAMGVMMITAIALAAKPAAALAWIATFTGAFCIAFFLGSDTFGLEPMLTFIGMAAVEVYIVGRVARWTYRQLDLTARFRSEAESVRMLLAEYERHGVGWLWQVDAENRIVYISSRIAALLGRPSGQVKGSSFPSMLGGNALLGQTLLARAPFSNLEIEMRTRQGTRWMALSGDPVIDVSGQFQGFRGVGSDITDARKTQERLTNLAQMDVLSGLPNRAKVRQLLNDALSGAKDGGAPCAIMFLDLDAFKPVNDTFGHPKGDIVLKGVAQRLLKEIGSAGHVGRMGGDEFAVVVNDVRDRNMVEILARRIINAIAEPFLIDKAEIRIGVSIGCAFGPSDGTSVDDLIQKADLALYQAKAQGRGTWRCFDAHLQNQAEGRARMERDMHDGLKRGEFRLLYQPLVDARTQALMGFEALIRWQHPGRGMVPPNDFIPLAEETGLVLPMGEWVIQEACRAAATWRSDVTVAVNLSPKQLASPSLPGVVREALSKHKLPANRIEMEVTETVFLGDTDGALEVLKRLRALGLGIALDDFGTGYSSLGYLNKAVFHKLKIDGSFVREAAKNQETVAIIQSIVALAKSFRMTVTAEGVETAEDFARMRDLGCHQIQGYLFGRPMSFEDPPALVNRGQSRISA